MISLVSIAQLVIKLLLQVVTELNHQWRYFYPYYAYGSPSPMEVPAQQKQIPGSFPEKLQYKKSGAYQKEKYDIKFDSILKNIDNLYKKLSQLEEENKALKEEVENIKPLTIENINYKIQDLNVQDLSGNLMVGLTALSDAEELKKLLEENDPIMFNEMNTDDFENQMMNNQAMNGQDEDV